MPEHQSTSEVVPHAPSEQRKPPPHVRDMERILGLDRRWALRRRMIQLGVLLAVAGLVTGGWVYWQHRQELAGRPSYQTAEVKRGKLTRTVTATGSLEPITKVDVGSEVSGLVEKVEVDFNDEVIEKQVLARLNTRDIEARIQQARASLLVARGNQSSAEATLLETDGKTRRLEAVGRPVVSPEELEIAQGELARARASVESATAQVAVAQATLDAELATFAKATIYSPIDGIVLSRKVEPGQTVAAAFQTPVLFTLARDLKRMRLIVDIDEADVGEVKEKQRATFQVDAYPHRRFEARVQSVRFDPQMVQDVVTYEAVLEVDNSELLLRPGMTATAEIATGIVEDALLVPNAALRFTPEGQEEKGNTASADARHGIVWVLRDNTPFAISLTLGISDDQQTVVADGDLEPGMTLITAQLNKNK
jgi:HlyD family secretion protein